MPRTILASRGVQRQIDKITDYYLKNANQAIAGQARLAIINRVNEMSQQPRSCTRVPNLDESYRAGMVKGYRYKVYYQILDPQTIKVLMIRHTSQKPPSPDQLKRAFRN